MKKILRPFVILFATTCLTPLDIMGQGMEIMQFPDYIRKEGGNYSVEVLLLDTYFAPPELPVPNVNILEDGFIEIKAINCSHQCRVEKGHIYMVELEVEAAVEFRDMVFSHIQLYFVTDMLPCAVDFWTQQPGLSAGSISPSLQNISYGQSPQKLTYSSFDISSISYVQWQQKVGPGGWTDIKGATGYSYSPGNIYETTEFRVVARSKRYYPGDTESVIVNVAPKLFSGKISSDQTIIPGTSAAPITSSTPASGGIVPITYQWQQSPNDWTWVDILGATSETYLSLPLSTKTFFRRKAMSGREFCYSNSVVILMKAPIAKYLSFKPVANVVSEKDQDTRTKGLKTYEKVAAVGGDSNAEAFAERAFYYDSRGRVIQIVEKNHLGGISYYSTKYDFVGNVLKTCEQHTVYVDFSSPDYYELLGDTNQKLTEFTYDHRGRMLTEKTTMDKHEPVIITYTYDQLGRLKGKTYSDLSESRSVSAPQVPSESYNYNIQGWLAEKSTPYFDMKLQYFDPQKPDSTPSYIGNITEWEWTHKSPTSGPDVANTYAFTYDKLSRLNTTKQYVDGVDNALNVEKGVTYDLNGNLRTLQRTASGSLSDDFSYTYSGNQLASISGTTSGSYTYDANGNMIQDGPHNLTLTYNHLNRIEKVIENGSVVANYSYLSDGAKISTADAVEKGLCYLGSFVYKKLGMGKRPILESVGFNGGRFVALATSSGTLFEPNYFVTDHLESVRAVVNSRGEVVEHSDYYPFGMRWTEGQLSDNRYRYNGKEEQAFVDVPYTDYGARMFDSKYRLTWNSSDLLAEKYYTVSPYAFCAANPISRIDTDGKKWVNANGYVKYQDGRWTGYATSYDRMLGAELLNTPTGKSKFDHLVNGPVITKVEFGKLAPHVYGQNSIERRYKGIYQATITLDMENMKEKAKDEGITVMQATASTVGHEIRHTEMENIEMQLQTQKEGSKFDYKDMPEEKDARAVGNRIIYEYQNNIKPISNGKDEKRSFWNTMYRNMFYNIDVERELLR